uniref:Uncharacterized protein n=1 Tax=Geobacillus sp. (strain Y4.1MC1) TaxID=581103 RepID=A0A7U3YCN0_GEOS0
MVRKRNRGYSQKVGLDDLLRQPLYAVCLEKFVGLGLRF